MSDTEELETADLKELAQRGTLEVSQVPSPPKLPTGPNVVVDLGPAPVKTPRGTARLPAPRGNGLVVLVYVLATAALAASIYLRWFA